MKLEILDRHQINDQQWNDVVANGSLPCIYGMTWFLDAVTSDWKAVIRFENNAYASVMPVPLRKKYGFTYVLQPIYCQFLGIFSKNNNEAEHGEFLNFLKNNFKNIVKFAFNEHQHFPDLTQNYTHLLPLNKPFKGQQLTAIRKGKKGRREAVKHGWQIRQTADIEIIIQLFKENHAARIGKVTDEAYNILRNTFSVAKAHQAAVAFEAVSPVTNAVEGGAIFWCANGRLIYQFCSASHFGQKKEARRAILLHVIEHFANQGFILDFETTNEDGFRWFHLSFGADEVYFSVLENVNMSPILSFLKKLQSWLR